MIISKTLSYLDRKEERKPKRFERKKERKPKGGFRDERCGLPHRLEGKSRWIVCTVNGLLESVRRVRSRAREKSGRITFKTATGGDDRVRCTDKVDS